jgi:hypothetical protein
MKTATTTTYGNARLARIVAALAAGGAAVMIAACGGSDEGSESSAAAPATIPQPSQDQLVAAGLDGLPLAPESKRLDIKAPVFTNPTEITNPLFPISELESAILSGKVDGKPFHTETTLLPQTRIIEWSPGQEVETRISQYFAYEDGRIEEVALDYYAQADDGSVWYMGEEVNDYNRQGFSDSTQGTWLAGKDGPPEMIMPADPQVGDVHRAENIPAIAFEEVEIKTVGKTVDGPRGQVDGAMVGRELHDDGTYSDKVFAPGYGEFFSAHGSEIEAMALAIPTDAIDEEVPANLEELTSSASGLIDAVRAGSWGEATAALDDARASWKPLAAAGVPPRLQTEMEEALRSASRATEAKDEASGGTAAIDIAQSATDLQLQYRPVADIDLARFALWARQILVDSEAGDVGGVRGDVTTLEWIRERLVETVEPADLTAIDAHLEVIRDTVAHETEDLRAAAAEAKVLTHPLALGPVESSD